MIYYSLPCKHGIYKYSSYALNVCMGCVPYLYVPAYCFFFFLNMGFLCCYIKIQQTCMHTYTRRTLINIYHEGADEDSCDSGTCYRSLLHHFNHLSFFFPWPPSSKVICWECRTSSLSSNVRFSLGDSGESSSFLIISWKCSLKQPK